LELARGWNLRGDIPQIKLSKGPQGLEWARYTSNQSVQGPQVPRDATYAIPRNANQKRGYEQWRKSA